MGKIAIYKNHKHISVLGLVILLALLPVMLLSLPQKTDVEQKAAELHDLNTANFITGTDNPDGTMRSGTLQNTASPTGMGRLLITFISASAMGNTRSTLADLSITISKGEVHVADAESQNTHTSSPTAPQLWTAIPMSLPVQIDITKLAAQKNFQQLPVSAIPSGHYVEMRLYISQAAALLNNGTVPSIVFNNHGNTIRIEKPFDILPGQTTTVTIDMNAQKSLIQEGPSYVLHPYIEQFLITK